VTSLPRNRISFSRELKSRDSGCSVQRLRICLADANREAVSTRFDHRDSRLVPKYSRFRIWIRAIYFYRDSIISGVCSRFRIILGVSERPASRIEHPATPAAHTSSMNNVKSGVFSRSRRALIEINNNLCTTLLEPAVARSKRSHDPRDYGDR